MLLPRVIPVLLLSGKGLVKGIHFGNHSYIGDPINTVQIFNAKEVDELIFLDITATTEKRIPSLDVIQRIADQCLMPFSVGGGIKTIKDIRDILNAGAEKVCINTAVMENPAIISQAANNFGRQSLIVSIDVKPDQKGVYDAYSHCGTIKTGRDAVAVARQMADLGAGEIMINSIDRDGTITGYDLPLIQQVCQSVSIPVIACGGAGSLKHLQEGIKIGGASAVAAGSFFVYQGSRRAVLISYPSKQELMDIRGQ
jgi:imidazole glycerol-phosphate synthase subunit HisF